MNDDVPTNPVQTAAFRNKRIEAIPLRSSLGGVDTLLSVSRLATLTEPAYQLMQRLPFTIGDIIPASATTNELVILMAPILELVLKKIAVIVPASES